MQHLESAIQLAMEEYRRLDAQASRVYASIAQLSSAPLTLEAALEADRLSPSNTSLASFFSPRTTPKQRQLALEGVLESLRAFFRRILTALSNLVQRVIAWLKQLVGKKKDDGREQLLAEAHRREQEIKAALEKAQRDFDTETQQRQQATRERNAAEDHARARHKHEAEQQSANDQAEAEHIEHNRKQRDVEKLARAQKDLDNEAAAKHSAHAQHLRAIGSDIDSFVGHVLSETSAEFPSALRRLLTSTPAQLATLAQNQSSYWSDLEHLHGIVNPHLAPWLSKVNVALGQMDDAVGFITFREAHAGTNEARVRHLVEEFTKVLESAPVPGSSRGLSDVVTEMRSHIQESTARSDKPLVYTLVQKTATDPAREAMFKEAMQHLHGASSELEAVSKTLTKLVSQAQGEVHAKLDTQGHSELSHKLQHSLHELAQLVQAVQHYAAEWHRADELFGRVVTLYTELQKAALAAIKQTNVPVPSGTVSQASK